MDRKPSPPSMCAMNMWCCTGFTGQSDCAGASKCSASTIRRLTITGAIPKLTRPRSEEHTSELQSLMRISYAVFCLKKKNNNNKDSKHRHKPISELKQSNTRHT